MPKRKLEHDVIDLTSNDDEGNSKPTALPSQLSFNLMSYNIDGLNEDALDERWMGVRNIVIRENPDIIFFQEVTPYLFPKVSQLKGVGYVCSDSIASYSALGHYFTVILVKQPWLTSANTTATFNRLAYSGQAKSLQGRNIISCNLKTSSGVEILLLNLHLESCGKAMESPESATRVNQLVTALRMVSTHPGPALCGGDLNLRNEEATVALRGCSVVDAAELLRIDKKKWNTWYCPGKPMVACRFDRLYSNDVNRLQPVSMRIVGDEEVVYASACSYKTFSDHRGLVVKYTTDLVVQSISNNEQSSSSNEALAGNTK
ncbi:hypothetical protein EON65_03865 [archaeon]|nr:MAG: hypothetical protein EON65_03865 [archaeon]